MAGKKKSPLWRQAFLRALKRTGNVRASAFEAGVDPGTAYDHRAKDPGFAAKWAAAKQAYDRMAARKKRAGPPLQAGPGSELVLRRTKHGDKLVRASPGRWSRRVEESFLDGLEATGCVRTAARAAGISTAALYERRDHYPEFAARWDERAGRAGTQLPGLLNAAAVESLSPQPEGAKRRGRARLPKVTVGEAIRISAINENARAKARGHGGERSRRPEKTHEDYVQEIAALVGMKRRQVERDRLREGWTDAGNGVLIPPGWVRAPKPGGARTIRLRVRRTEARAEPKRGRGFCPSQPPCRAPGCTKGG